MTVPRKSTYRLLLTAVTLIALACSVSSYVNYSLARYYFRHEEHSFRATVVILWTVATAACAFETFATVGWRVLSAHARRGA